ncbi:MAG: DUF1501 domain-containing protein [Comamonadaceae bacterium]|nr:DUF1501 domain-containing protein [Comamonadaceae bacterium]RRD56656.1 DUF1501 domain-containing protein [Comamonadaceae bacterium OH2545_COT-014]
MKTPSGDLARRAFLQRMGQLGVAGTVAPWAMNLAVLGEAAAQSADDYKALVCVFLSGGNDNGNTVVPYDPAGHAAYAQARGSVALPRNTLAKLNNATGLPSGQEYALHPQLAGLAGLYNSGKLAVQMNVGTLRAPTTLEQFKRRQGLPPKLFSHNDQQSVWQSSSAEGASKGWGGQLGDQLQTGNLDPTFTCVSVAGTSVFLAGEGVLQYQLGSSGVIPIYPATNRYVLSGASTACMNALHSLITERRHHVLENELNLVTGRSMRAHTTLSAAIEGSKTQFDAVLPSRGAVGANTNAYLPLNVQLKMVARMIAARQTLGMKRQVFMVILGTFDHHEQLLANHADKLKQVDLAMTGFQQAVESLGLGKQVTTFTASEFGRTISPNNNGSDHGWGGHHFVMGGAVKGGAFYGKPPSQIMGGEEDVGQGRYIPSTSVDQYAATMARWFGVPDNQLDSIFPNLRQFKDRSLGFMG